MPWTNAYLPEDDTRISFPAEARVRTYVEALLEAQKQLLESDSRVMLIGEGIDDPGGVFGSTKGLAHDFGQDRVMDTPLAENGMTGVAIGAAMAGMRPILIHMRTDFLPMSMDQIVNHAAKIHTMTGGRTAVPLVVRSIIGRGWGSAAQHSQALHPLFLSVPGLRIVMPSTPYDAKGLLAACVKDGNPVIFMEHRWLYGLHGAVPEEAYTVPLGRGIVRRSGTDATVVAISAMVPEAMRAARDLEQQGISIEVIDPRTLRPLDMELILDSISRTGRLVIADPACPMGGAGAEITCRIAETAPRLLRAPVRRVQFPDAPVPSSPVLEQAYFPGAPDIVQAVTEICT